VNIIGIIPARMASTRFPGKPLKEILGKAMIHHVYWRSKMAKSLKDVYIATCDKEIEEYCQKNNMKVVMTKDTHRGASDRAAEAMLKIEEATSSKVDSVFMIQGDEPMLVPEMIELAAAAMLKDNHYIVNLVTNLKDQQEHEDPNEVKVVVGKDNVAVYFSREPIPSGKKWDGDVPMLKQLGLILFSRDFLLKFNELPATPLEKIESVDMLRVIEHGYKVKTVKSEHQSYGVDTLEDLQKVEELMRNDSLVNSCRVNNNKKLRVGIAGYGVVGERRRQFIDSHPSMQTVAVCDTKFSGDIKKPKDVQCFINYQELLSTPLDVLFVCLPNYLAPEVTIAGLQNGLHVFCEKPPGRTVADIERVIEEEQKHPELTLKYGFNHRYHDSVREALRIIQSGQLGEIVNLRGVYGKSKIIPFSKGWRAERRYAGGGILLDQGIHMVDLMRLFGGEFTEVNSYISDNYWHHDVEDNAYAIMRNTQDRIAMLHSSATQWQHRFSLHIALKEGFLELRGLLTGSKSYGEEKLIIGKRSESAVGASQQDVLTYLEDNSWRDEIYEFAEAVINKKPIEFGNSKDALETMKLVYRIYYADSQWRNKHNIVNPDKLQN